MIIAGASNPNLPFAAGVIEVLVGNFPWASARETQRKVNRGAFDSCGGLLVIEKAKGSSWSLAPDGYLLRLIKENLASRPVANAFQGKRVLATG